MKRNFAKHAATALCATFFATTSTLLTPARAQNLPDNAKYAVHSSGLAVLIGYCFAKYGPIYGDTPGGKCANRGREILAKADLPKASRDLAAKCPDATTFSTCATPFLFGINGALATAFAANGL